MSKLVWMTSLVLLLVAGSIAALGYATAPGTGAPRVLVTPAPTPDRAPAPYTNGPSGLPSGMPPDFTWRVR